MDIRIGNDIKLNFDLSKVKIYDPANIESIQCLFVKDHCCNKNSDFPHICPTEYTIHSCGVPVYNVDVNYHNNHHCHCDSCCCGFSVKNGWNSDDVFSTTQYQTSVRGKRKLMSVWFNAANQRCGKYRVVLHVTVKSTEDDKKYHSYRLDYGYVFNITDDPNAKEGDIEFDMFDLRVVNVAQIIDVANFIDTEDTFSADSVFLYEGSYVRCELFYDLEESIQDEVKNYLIIRPSYTEDYIHTYYVFEELGVNDTDISEYKYFGKYTEEQAPVYIKQLFGTQVANRNNNGLMTFQHVRKLENTASISDLIEKSNVIEITEYLYPDKYFLAGDTYTINSTPATEMRYLIDGNDYILIFRYLDSNYYVFIESSELIDNRYKYFYKARYDDATVPDYIKYAFDELTTSDKLKLNNLNFTTDNQFKTRGIRIQNVEEITELGHLDSTSENDVELVNEEGDINLETPKGALHARANDTIELSQKNPASSNRSHSELIMDGDVHINAGSGHVKIEAHDSITLQSDMEGNHISANIKLRVDDGLSATLDKDKERFNIVSKELRWVEKTPEGDKEHLLSEELGTLSNLKQNAITKIDVEHGNNSVILHASQNGSDDEVEIAPATQMKAGVMSAADKEKLDRINIQNKFVFVSSNQSWDEICAEAETAIQNNGGYPVSLLIIEDNVDDSDIFGCIQHGSAVITEQGNMLIYTIGYYRRTRRLFTKNGDVWINTSEEIKTF